MRTTARAFSFFLVGALAFIALLTPTTVEAQDAGIVTIELGSADPSVAATMPAGSTWTVSDGTNTIDGVFAEGDLELPTTIVTENPVPGGTYTVTINAGPTFEPFSGDYDVNGDTPISISLTPVVAQPETALVEASAYECEGLTEPGLLTDVGADCVATSATFDFYLVGDGSGEPNYTLPVDGSGTIDVQVGDYEVFASGGTTFALTVPAEGTAFNYGYPGEAPPAETGFLEVTTYACEGVEGDPVVLGEVGPDCTQIAADLTFYLWGDGTDDSWSLTTTETGAVSIELPVGGYDVVNEATQSTVGIQVPAGSSTVAIGYPTSATPAPETGVLDVTTYSCEGVVGDPVVLEEVGPDCTQIAADLTFYLWGDGTDDSWSLSTTETGAVSIELPVGGYDVVNEATQSTVGLQVPAGSSAVAIGYAASGTPDPELGTLNINTIMCPNVEAPMVTNIVDDDCVRVGKNITFYLVGDGTDDNWPVTTSNAETTVVNLPVGDYEIVDEASQARLFVSVTTGVADLNIAYPWVDDPVDPTPPPVTELPETGTGSGSNIGALGAVAGGAILAAGALGVRIRKS